MHEGAVCREIMDITGRAAKEGGLEKVYEIVISAGPYSCIHESQLNFFFDAAKDGTSMAEAVIRVEIDESLTGPQQMYVKSIKGD